MSDTGLRQRLAAILAADAAGYSRLMAADERATVEALDAARAVFRKQIDTSRGRVIDMAGDSVLAVFDLASGAVGAALVIQQELDALSSAAPADRRMRFRIGVHLGEIIEKADGTVYGDGVNVAARIQGLAEAGGLAISDEVYRLVRDRLTVHWSDGGEHAVKNIPRWPPASMPCAMMASQPFVSRNLASSTVVAEQIILHPAAFTLAINSFSGSP